MEPCPEGDVLVICHARRDDAEHPERRRDMAFERRSQVVLLALVALLAAGCTFITRASVDTAGGDPNDNSSEASVSGDGRYIAFGSDATDLVPGDGNATRDVFRRDLRLGTTTRVSVDVGGGDPNGTSSAPSISADGHLVAFTSSATDLVVGDGNESPSTDVFVRDVESHATTRASLDAAGGDPDSSSFDPAISADGRFVTFTSDASDLVPGDGNAARDVFVRDLRDMATTRVSVDTTGGDSNGESLTEPSISANGRRVAFESSATDLVPSGETGVFVRDLGAGITTLVASGSCCPSISGSGRHVAFGFGDLFVRNLSAGTTTQVSVDTEGGDPNNMSFRASISADGRYVAFESFATDLVLDDGNVAPDIFVRDLRTNTTTRSSVDLLGREVVGISTEPAISADGRYVAFDSSAPSLVGNDRNGAFDVFVRGVVTPTVESVEPSALDRGETRTLTVRGSGFVAPVSVFVPAAEGVTVQSVEVHSETKLTVSVRVDPGASTGERDLVVFPLGTGPGPLSTGFGLCSGCLTVT
jgi:Tol biopolymer transport system component